MLRLLSNSGRLQTCVRCQLICCHGICFGSAACRICLQQYALSAPWSPLDAPVLATKRVWYALIHRVVVGVEHDAVC